MSTNKLLDQMLEHLVNDEKEKAEELFHEYVVTKSREIYESLIEDEMKDDEDDEDVDEAAKDEDAEEDKVDEASDNDDDDEVDENYEDLAIEADDDMDMMGGDPTDDLAGDLDADMDDEDDDMEERDPEDLFQDLDAIVDELQAKFDAMQGGEEGDMDDDDEMKDDFDLETVREYVEKVPAGHGAEKRGSAEKADSTKSLIDNMKNDMGGTTANILSSKEDAGTMAGQGQLKGSSLSGQKPTEDNAGNINVPGAKNGNAFNKKEPGHGAEKKGSAENADKSAGSLFRGRR